MQGDALGGGPPGDVFPAVDPRPAAWRRERLAAWPQVAWFLVAWLRAFRHPHHLQVEQEVDWQSVVRGAYWVTEKHLA